MTQPGGVRRPSTGKRLGMTLDGFDEVLPTYALMARFRVDGGPPDQATQQVAGRLTSAALPFHEVEVERSEPDGTHFVVVRFVETSVDGQTAVAGLYETLVAAGVSPDEVWLGREYA